MYRTLDPTKIVDTAFSIAQRVAERFPGSGLSKVAADLTAVAKDASAVAAGLGKPNVPLRIAVGAASVIFISLIAVAISAARVDTQVRTATELAQGIESAITDLFFAAVAIWFLTSIETRLKRRRALDLLAQLRSLAHVIDMHQLTKDPDRLGKTDQATPSSPPVPFTPALLKRYLDYCSEMLAILSKLSALLIQDFDDAATLSAVNEIEELTSGLQRKVWQKIMIADQTFGG